MITNGILLPGSSRHSIESIILYFAFLDPGLFVVCLVFVSLGCLLIDQVLWSSTVVKYCMSNPIYCSKFDGSFMVNKIINLDSDILVGQYPDIEIKQDRMTK